MYSLILRGAVVASAGVIALCLSTTWGEIDSFELEKVAHTTCGPGRFGPEQAVLASPVELGSTRFEFRSSAVPDLQAERASPETRVWPTVNPNPPTSATRTTATRTTLPASSAPAALGGVRVLAHRARKLSVAGIRHLQRELRRLGCYSGQIDGDWGPASRYAASQFTGAINAALPVDTPEPALLALARLHNGSNCSKSSEGSAIITASTAPIPRASVIGKTTALENIPVDRTPSARRGLPPSPYAWGAPRIVRADGLPATDGGFEGESSDGKRMALGAAPQSAPKAQTPHRQARTTHVAPKRRSEDRSPRARREPRGRRQTARRGRRTWEQRVLQAVNLSGG